jgi:hypothetical protein
MQELSEEAVMTDARDTQHGRKTQATADRESEVESRPIPDLEVTSADAEVIRAGEGSVSEMVVTKHTDSASV